MPETTNNTGRDYSSIGTESSYFNEDGTRDTGTAGNGIDTLSLQNESIQTTFEKSNRKYMKVNTKDYSQMSYFISGIDVTQQNLDQMTPYIPGISRIFMHRTPLFMEIGFKQRTLQFKSLIETGAKAIGGIGNIRASFTSMDGGFNGQSFDMISKSEDESNALTISVYEQGGSIVRNYLDLWINGVRDHRSGVAHYHGLVETPEHSVSQGYIPYSEKNHTAEFIYYSLDPTAHFIEYSCLWAHCMPEEVTKDHLNYTSGSRDVPEIQISFHGTKYESRYINDIAINYLMKDQLDYNYLNFNPTRISQDDEIDYRLNLINTSSGTSTTTNG